MINVTNQVNSTAIGCTSPGFNGVVPAKLKSHKVPPGLKLKSTKLHRSTSPKINCHNQFKSPTNIPKSGIFIGEMKKHGIITALNDINKFSEFFETLPTKTDEGTPDATITTGGTLGTTTGGKSQVMSEQQTQSPASMDNKFESSMVTTGPNQGMITPQTFKDHKNRYEVHHILSNPYISI